jgi:hypothetical protein
VLAYVFWHRPASGVDRDAYETRLAAFHAALAAAPPAGFRRSVALRVGGAPWLAGEGYEDWYLLDGSATLDRLNEAAVSGSRRSPHDTVAGLAGEGSGGLYRNVAGTEGLDEPTAQWFAKPAGTSYDALMDGFRDLTGSGVWQRQMTLGPTPEYCLRGPGAAPAGSDPARLSLVQVFPE